MAAKVHHDQDKYSPAVPGSPESGALDDRRDSIINALLSLQGSGGGVYSVDAISTIDVAVSSASDSSPNPSTRSNSSDHGQVSLPQAPGPYSQPDHAHHAQPLVAAQDDVLNTKETYSPLVPRLNRSASDLAAAEMLGLLGTERREYKASPFRDGDEPSEEYANAASVLMALGTPVKDYARPDGSPADDGIERYDWSSETAETARLAAKEAEEAAAMLHMLNSQQTSRSPLASPHMRDPGNQMLHEYDVPQLASGNLVLKDANDDGGIKSEERGRSTKPKPRRKAKPPQVAVDVKQEESMDDIWASDEFKAHKSTNDDKSRKRKHAQLKSGMKKKTGSPAPLPLVTPPSPKPAVSRGKLVPKQHLTVAPSVSPTRSPAAGRVSLLDLIEAKVLYVGQGVYYSHHGNPAHATITDDGRIKSQCGKIFATPSGWAKWHANGRSGEGPLQINGWESVKVNGEPISAYRARFIAGTAGKKPTGKISRSPSPRPVSPVRAKPKGVLSAEPSPRATPEPKHRKPRATPAKAEPIVPDAPDLPASAVVCPPLPHVLVPNSSVVVTTVINAPPISCTHCGGHGIGYTWAICSTCGECTHAVCLDAKEKEVMRINNRQWKCSACLTCELCAKTSATREMIRCIGCANGAHSSCAGVLSNDKEPYMCDECGGGARQLRRKRAHDKPLIEESIPETEFVLRCDTTSTPFTGRDTRMCALCHEEGDKTNAEQGLLLPAHFDTFVHAQCALWSTDVALVQDRILTNVVAAIMRGQKQTCIYCDRPGATLGCCNEQCPAVLHLPCAQKSGAKLLCGEDGRREVCCKACSPSYSCGRMVNRDAQMDANIQRSFLISFEVDVALGYAPPDMKSVPLRLQYGSLCVTNFGNFSVPPTTVMVGRRGYACTDRYSCTRVLGGRIYKCTVRTKGPVFAIEGDGIAVKATTPQGAFNELRRTLNPEALAVSDTARDGIWWFGLSMDGVRWAIEQTQQLKAKVPAAVKALRLCPHEFTWASLDVNATRNSVSGSRSQSQTPAQTPLNVSEPMECDDEPRQRRRSSTFSIPAMEMDEETLQMLWEAPKIRVARLDDTVSLNAVVDIEKNAAVTVFRGECVSVEDAKKRQDRYRMQGLVSFVVQIDDRHMLDGTVTPNMARFVQKSAEPNTYSRRVVVRKDDTTATYIVLFAASRIAVGQTLSYDFAHNSSHVPA